MARRLVKPRKRKAPTLIQNASGAWYARYRKEGISLPLGIRTPKRPKTEKPPATSQYEWIQVGRFYYPKHAYDIFQADFELPYLRGEFTPKRAQQELAVTEAVDLFVNRAGLTESTRRSYRGVLNVFTDSLMDPRMLLNELRIEDVKEFLDKRQLRAASRASYARQINAFLNWAWKNNLLETDPLQAEVRYTSTGRLGRKLFLSPDEYIAIRRAVRDTAEGLPDTQQAARHVIWTIDVFDLAIATGLRIDELVHLQWQDVRLERGILEVRPKAVERDGFDFMPKGKRARFIELQPLAVAVLNRPHIAMRKGDPLSCVLNGPASPDQDGDVSINPGRASKTWRKHREQVGVSDPVPLHGLRHMYVTYLLILGYETFYVQNWAGHSSITTTEGYAQFSRQLCARREREALIEQIESLGFYRP